MYKGLKMSYRVLILCSIMLTLFSNVYSQNVSVPIVLYHNITEKDDNSGKLLHVSKDIFTQQIKAIKDAGYNTISYDEYYNYYKYGTTLPANPIIISFDDGYLSNYTYGYSVLKEFNMKATIFVITKYVGASANEVTFPHFTWDEAREMVNSGLITIGSHSHTHIESTKVSQSDLIFELRKSKYLIETNLGISCNVLAYPFGDANVGTRNAAILSGYKMVNLVGDVGVNTKNTPLDGLKRLTIRGDMSGFDVINMINLNMSK